MFIAKVVSVIHDQMVPTRKKYAPLLETDSRSRFQRWGSESKMEHFCRLVATCHNQTVIYNSHSTQKCEDRREQTTGISGNNSRILGRVWDLDPWSG